jgi:hypothetical protein
MFGPYPGAVSSALTVAVHFGYSAVLYPAAPEDEGSFGSHVPTWRSDFAYGYEWSFAWGMERDAGPHSTSEYNLPLRHVHDDACRGARFVWDRVEFARAESRPLLPQGRLSSSSLASAASAGSGSGAVNATGALVQSSADADADADTDVDVQAVHVFERILWSPGHMCRTAERWARTRQLLSEQTVQFRLWCGTCPLAALHLRDSDYQICEIVATETAVHAVWDGC